jgi:hypothetical protein
MATKGEACLRNQSGVALVIALIMIVVLTLIGLASTLSSNFENQLSGNKRGSTDSFYTADSGMQGVQANIANFNKDSYTKVTTTMGLPPTTDSKLTSPSINLPAGVSFYPPLNVTIYHSYLSGPPRGSHFSAAGNYEFAYFVIDSTGYDQLNVSLVTSNSQHEVKVFRLLPTSQGGI